MSANKYFRSKLPCLLLFLAAACSPLLAQNPRIESLTIADGLSQGMIYDILQDRDGFLWFATKDGLNRYDGYRFQVFTNDPFDPFSIAGNEIWSLFEDSAGNIWTHIFPNKLDMYERATGRFFHLDTWNGKPLSPHPGAFEQTPDGGFWIGSRPNLYRFRWKEKLPSPLPANPDLAAHVLLEEVVLPGKPVEGDITFDLATMPDGSLTAFRVYGNSFAVAPGNGTAKALDFKGIEPLAHFKDSKGRVYLISQDNRLFAVENGGLREIALPAALKSTAR